MYAIRSYYDQSATFYKFDNADSKVTLANAEVLQGKELSYNNLLDADAAWKCASDAFHSVNHIENKVAVSVINVITSYSIHYTKLYDPAYHGGQLYLIHRYHFCVHVWHNYTTPAQPAQNRPSPSYNFV